MVEDLENVVTKTANQARQNPARWTKSKEKSVINPLCTEKDLTFIGYDPYLKKPAWRRLRTFQSSASKESSFPPVILIPPTGGLSLADRIFASSLARKGFNVFALAAFEGWDDYSDQVNRHNRQSVQSIEALRELQLWLDQPVLVIGASLGALYGLQAFGNNSRVQKLVLVVAGMDFAGIMTDSKISVAVKNKKARKEKFQLKTDHDYRRFMKNNFYVEPGIFAQADNDSAKYFLILATQDKVVPTKYQKKLLETLPKAHVAYFHSGHVFTVVKAYLFYQKEIIRFLLA